MINFFYYIDTTKEELLLYFKIPFWSILWITMKSTFSPTLSWYFDILTCSIIQLTYYSNILTFLSILHLPNNVQFYVHETLSSTSKVEINFFLLTPRHFNFVANKVKIFTGTTIQSYMLYKLMSHTEFYISMMLL